jgi:acetoin utilization deacetylase AcuC-like enzyme
VHQDNLYPTDSGFIDDIGDESAAGSVINIPLPAGSGNGAYVETLDKVVVPAIRRFKPDVIVVASGFDASASDPLGRMFTASGYRQLTEMLLAVADEVCEGRVMMTHEGGYSPTYVPYCGLAVLEAMSGVKTDIDDPFGPGYERLPDQALTETQASRIAQAAGIHGL